MCVGAGVDERARAQTAFVGDVGEFSPRPRSTYSRVRVWKIVRNKDKDG